MGASLVAFALQLRVNNGIYGHAPLCSRAAISLTLSSPVVFTGNSLDDSSCDEDSSSRFSFREDDDDEAAEELPSSSSSSTVALLFDELLVGLDCCDKAKTGLSSHASSSSSDSSSWDSTSRLE